MNNIELHNQEVSQLQKQLRDLLEKRNSQVSASPIALKYRPGSSYTMRTKSYKGGCNTLDCGALDRVLSVDKENQTAIVEPRVTMKALVKTTLPYGLTAPVIPELKDITIGGAIMGMAGESASHRWGTFNDACAAFTLLCGDGSLIRVSPFENSDLFYGVPGSYGSLGTLTSAEIKLVPSKDVVHLRYRIFSSPREAVGALISMSQNAAASDFLDGIILSKDLAIVIEGNLASKGDFGKHLPKFSTGTFYSQMYYQHVHEIALEANSDSHEEWMTHEDYFFRYDLGAFWMGAYLFRYPILWGLFAEGILKLYKSKPDWFSEERIRKYHNVINPGLPSRMIMHPLMPGYTLCKWLHKAENWVQNRFIIQDLCIPKDNALKFLDVIMDDPGIYPMWLLPIKGTRHPQIFAPHLLSDRDREGLFINFGIYGIPSYSAPTEQITKKLEHKTKEFKGRKVLYSHSYYDQNEFWNIYSRESYNILRDKAHAKGTWYEITDKVLSA